MAARETKWKAGVVREMRAMGALVFQIVASRMQEPGWPDTYVSTPRWSGFVEFKFDDTPTSTKQRIVLRRLRQDRADGAFVLRHPDSLEDADGRRICAIPTRPSTGAGLLRTLGEGRAAGLPAHAGIREATVGLDDPAAGGRVAPDRAAADPRAHDVGGRRVLVVGERGTTWNPRDPWAFRDSPSREKLLRLGVDPWAHECVNLCPPAPQGDPWDERLVVVPDVGPYDLVFLCGRRVAAVVGFRGELLDYRDGVMLLPHPSGLSRWWNDPGAVARGRETVGRFVCCDSETT